MKFINLTPAKEFPVIPFNRKFFNEGHNNLIWANHNIKLSIEISRLENHVDRIMAKSPNGSLYTIIPEKSNVKDKGFVIQSNQKTLKQTWKLIEDGVILKWKSFKAQEAVNEIPNDNDLESVISSIGDKQILKQEMIDGKGNLIKTGLRAPQIGAIFSILANWAITGQPITVVLPTGTGKSESILGTILAAKIKRSLIIVPSDGLRDQFFNNCKSWGILRKIGIVDSEILNPIVLKLESTPKEEDVFNRMILHSNIIIATTAILNKLPNKFIKIIGEVCNAVFIDEAHHSAAPTWEFLKNQFADTKIVQFTATPFREDKKPVNGKVVFNYSLEEAQKNEYFTKIDFIPVIDYDPETSDKTVANKAIEILRKDIEEGHRHFLMARVDKIEKANDIYDKYYKQYSEFNPILINSKTKNVNEQINKLRTGESKIVVCVNMLGEGIDIPELKIAALHDIRKSLTVTLQFIGRFTRSNKSKASAKIIANIADVEIEKRLKQLYKEDADWGKLIAFASAKEIQKKIKFQELLMNFNNSKIPLYNIKPKLSAVVYKTNKETWSPEKLTDYLDKNEILYLYDINEVDNIALAIYQEDNNIDWLDSKVFVESTWQLLLFYFDKERKLLYVNSSLKNVESEIVLKLAGIDRRFETEEPFKCYSGLGYVVLFTLGLDKNTDSPIKYAMYAGDNVYEGISDMEKNRSSKSNTYGYGFKDGVEITLGASKKGKVWSRLIGNIQEWKDWCDELGTKLLDSSIDVDKIFKGFLQPKRFDITGFTNLSDPISIDWPSTFYQDIESSQSLIINGKRKDISEISLFISKNNDGYKVHLVTEGAIFYLNIAYDTKTFSWSTENSLKVEYSRKTKSVDFISFLKDDDTFKIRLVDGTFVENNYHFKPYKQETIFPLDINLLTSINWTGTNTSIESMGFAKPYISNSIQHKIFKEKEANPLFQIIINDDNAGEAADLICIGVQDDALVIEAIHCKYMLRSDQPGSRTKDFYELACQAQKTIKNFSNAMRLYDHIKYRNAKSNEAGHSRFLKGDLRNLEILIKSFSYRRPKLKVILVQPALAKNKVNNNVLELLGSTYTLLQETINANFEVICS